MHPWINSKIFTINNKIGKVSKKFGGELLMFIVHIVQKYLCSLAVLWDERIFSERLQKSNLIFAERDSIMHIDKRRGVFFDAKNFSGDAFRRHPFLEKEEERVCRRYSS